MSDVLSTSAFDLKQFKIRFLRTILRGYRALKKSDGIGQLNLAFESLSVERCFSTEHYSELIFGSAKKDGELVVRQFILTKLISRLRNAALYGYGREKRRLLFPLPPTWRQIVIDHGFKLDKCFSKISWNILTLAFLFYGYYFILKHALLCLSCSDLHENKEFDRYAFFDSLSDKNLPFEDKLGKKLGIISWYLQWGDRPSHLDSIRHTVKSSDLLSRYQGIKIQSISSAIPLPRSTWSVIRYCAWGAAASFIATFDLLRGRWWHALMLAEAAKGALIRISRSDQLARDYLFHNSSWIYRPLWTYDAEAKGSRIILYFYSTNCQHFKRDEMCPRRAYYGYKAMSWPHYLVWDDYQRNYFKNILEIKSRIDVVGSIWFSASRFSLPTLSSRAVAVFDVQPLRKSLYNTLCVEYDYYTPSTVSKFLIDISEVLAENACVMALKRKRNIGNLIHPSYKRELRKLECIGGFVAIDPELDAEQLIDKCLAVISLPFTSTALLAREANKPSVYYDPHGVLHKDDPAAHGIEVIQDKDRLGVWLNEAINGFPALVTRD
jgi:polysaccharide biosynthesis PFTS motif protein